MPLKLPTDTAHFRTPTRQYEAFGRPLGQGIERRKLWVGAIFISAWWPLLALLGVPPLGRLGPLLYLAPVGMVTVLGARSSDDGRMALMRAYDWLLALLPSRHRPLRNPALRQRRPRGVLRLDVRTHIDPTPLTPTTDHEQSTSTGES